LGRATPVCCQHTPRWAYLAWTSSANSLD
jgi:hypothetical protein